MLKGISSPELDVAVANLLKDAPADKHNGFGMAINDQGVVAGIRLHREGPGLDWQAKAYGGVDFHGRPIVGLDAGLYW